MWHSVARFRHCPSIAKLVKLRQFYGVLKLPAYSLGYKTRQIFPPIRSLLGQSMLIFIQMLLGAAAPADRQERTTRTGGQLRRIKLVPPTLLGSEAVILAYNSKRPGRFWVEETN